MELIEILPGINMTLPQYNKIRALITEELNKRSHVHTETVRHLVRYTRREVFGFRVGSLCTCETICDTNYENVKWSSWMDICNPIWPLTPKDIDQDVNVTFKVFQNFECFDYDDQVGIFYDRDSKKIVVQHCTDIDFLSISPLINDWGEYWIPKFIRRWYGLGTAGLLNDVSITLFSHIPLKVIETNEENHFIVVES